MNVSTMEIVVQIFVLSESAKQRSRTLVRYVMTKKTVLMGCSAACQENYLRFEGAQLHVNA